MLEQRAADGTRVPALEQRPTIGLGMEPFVDAWRVLQDRRTIGYSGPNPLGLEQVAAYLEIRGIHDQELRDDILAMILQLDRRWFEKYQAKAKAKKEKGGTDGG